ncbi:NAD-dependent epimerase/dehydratase family protein [Flavitalea sp.]|nr:NAD(P)-dependent oxidoreductase [Flavitalea sp.]
MKKVLITGGSGFIGTNLIDSLRNDEFLILNIDSKKPVIDVHLSYWQNINILDYQKLAESIKSFAPDIIIHLAAVTDLNGTDLEYYKPNIEGTRNIIRIAAELQDLKRVIFTSSMYVCKPGWIPKDYDSYKPHTVYGESKVKGEQIVKAIKNASYEWTIIRPTSIWGPWFDIPYIDFFKVVYSKRYFDFGKACRKTYGFIGNTVAQIRILMDADNINKKTFYLGDDPPIQISEWANEISVNMGKGRIRRTPYNLLKVAAVVGDTLSLLKIKFPLTSFRLKNMTTDNILPLKDLYEVTGQPVYSRKEGIQQTLNWLEKHKGYEINNPN